MLRIATFCVGKSNMLNMENIYIVNVGVKYFDVYL